MRKREVEGQRAGFCNHEGVAARSGSEPLRIGLRRRQKGETKCIFERHITLNLHKSHRLPFEHSTKKLLFLRKEPIIPANRTMLPSKSGEKSMVFRENRKINPRKSPWFASKMKAVGTKSGRILPKNIDFSLKNDEKSMILREKAGNLPKRRLFLPK